MTIQPDYLTRSSIRVERPKGPDGPCWITRKGDDFPIGLISVDRFADDTRRIYRVGCGDLQSYTFGTRADAVRLWLDLWNLKQRANAYQGPRA